ncbi:MAG: rhomboid family intramembrane serine protease [Deltaproteobacteria bacterium]|nr:rhomboid family intramembrane serine protease [Deltaproteobacteria bacterium]
MFLHSPFPTVPGISLARLLIVINGILFAVMLGFGLRYGMGLKPFLNPSTPLLIHVGAQFWPLTLGRGELWRCVSYAFTHAGIIHLGFNLTVLYQVGTLVEGEIGRSRFLTLYTATALTATLAGLLWHPQTPVVGASGSLFGLIGFAAVFYHRLGIPAALQRRDVMLKWAAFAFLFGLMVGADNAGHLGGVLGGGLLALLFPLRHRTTPFLNLLGYASGAVLVAGLLGLFGSWLLR